MKKIITSWVFTLTLMLCTAVAQPGARMMENIEAMKVGFITQKLDLSPEEAQKFWPIYNKYADELEKLRIGFKGKMRADLSDMESMTDAQADKALNEMLNFKMAEVDITRKYVSEFKKVLPIKKVVLLFKAEQEFKVKLLSDIKERRKRDR
ncbi:MAG: hypothetical protein Q8M15_14240 [Bacteroidota bacterium]|nr:hypothetical protein [Bacteroidota bacterium]